MRVSIGIRATEEKEKGLEGTSVSDVDRYQVRAFLGGLHPSIAPATLARKLAAIRSFFKFLCREGVVRENPAIDISAPKLPKRLPNILSVDDVNALLVTPNSESATGRRDRQAKMLRGMDARGQWINKF